MIYFISHWQICIIHIEMQLLYSTMIMKNNKWHNNLHISFIQIKNNHLFSLNNITWVTVSKTYFNTILLPYYLSKMYDIPKMAYNRYYDKANTSYSAINYFYILTKRIHQKNNICTIYLPICIENNF